MAGITLAQAEAQLALYIAAEAAVLAKQSYTINGRSLSLADLSDIQAGIELWNNRATTLSNQLSGRGRSRVMVPAG